MNREAWLAALADELRRRGVAPDIAGQLATEAARGGGYGGGPTFGSPGAVAGPMAGPMAGPVTGPVAGPVTGPVRLDARGVTKRYRRRTVLSGVNLTVHAGEVAAVIGANGCGKTTFLRICAGLVSADEGSVLVAGTLGYCPQDSGTCEFLTPDEHFVLVGAGRGLGREQARQAGRRHAAALDWPPEGPVQTRYLSGGTRQKLNLVMASLGDPDILLLDEPYQGFDRGAYLDFWQEVWRWRDAGKAIVVVTHLLNQLDRVDQVLDLTPNPDPAPNQDPAPRPDPTSRPDLTPNQDLTSRTGATA